MRPAERAKPSKAESSDDAVATPVCDMPDTFPQGRRRNVAVVRRRPPTERLQRCSKAIAPADRARQKLPCARRTATMFLAAKPLTMAGAPAYISPLGTPPPRGGLACREAPHCSAVNIRPRALGPGGCAGFGGFSSLCCLGEGGRKTGPSWVSGCLTSESEERETWTAESLRAAFAIGKPFAQSGRKRLRRSTFQVNTMIVTVSNHRNGQSGTSSNVVISRDQISST